MATNIQENNTNIKMEKFLLLGTLLDNIKMKTITLLGKLVIYRNIESN